MNTYLIDGQTTFFDFTAKIPTRLQRIFGKESWQISKSF